jgi:hypothetical protein
VYKKIVNLRAAFTTNHHAFRILYLAQARTMPFALTAQINSRVIFLCCGNPAVLLRRPVAFRPCLATGVAFSLQFLISRQYICHSRQQLAVLGEYFRDGLLQSYITKVNFFLQM